MRVGGTERPQRMDKERRSACACSPKEQNTDTTVFLQITLVSGVNVVLHQSSSVNFGQSINTSPMIQA